MVDNVNIKAREILDNYLEMHNHRKTRERYFVLDAICRMPGCFTLKELDANLRL